MEIVGYARVSSVGQSLDVQLEKLAKASCSKVYKEKRSGRQAENRPQLQAALEYVREGDVLVVSRLDRMARSVLDLAKIADLLRKKRVSLRVLDQGLDTSVKFGRKKALTTIQEERIRRMRAEEGFSIEQLAERFSISRSSVYRALQKQHEAT